MGWKFWESPKSQAQISLEQLQSGAGPAAVPPAADRGAGSTSPPDGLSFRMPVEDVFSITGRGIVVTGTVESGSVRTGQTVMLSSVSGASRQLVVGGIESFRTMLDTAGVGQNVGLLLKGISRDDVAPGDVLSA